MTSTIIAIIQPRTSELGSTRHARVWPETLAPRGRLDAVRCHGTCRHDVSCRAERNHACVSSCRPARWWPVTVPAEWDACAVKRPSPRFSVYRFEMGERVGFL